MLSKCDLSVFYLWRSSSFCLSPLHQLTELWVIFLCKLCKLIFSLHKFLCYKNFFFEIYQFVWYYKTLDWYKMRQISISSSNDLISDVWESIWRIPLIDSTSFDKSGSSLSPNTRVWIVLVNPEFPHSSTRDCPFSCTHPEWFHAQTWWGFGKGTERPRQKQWLLLLKNPF